MAEKLIAPFSADEIEAVVKALPINKAPGPDGYPGEFYKKMWPIIKDDIIAAITNFHQHGDIPRTWGSTHIVLIPKVSKPVTLKDYRPISVIIDALNRGGSGPAQFQSEFERIHACSRPDDPIYFCKVERDHVRAPKVLARTARQIQQTIYTVHLQDDRIRSGIRWSATEPQNLFHDMVLSRDLKSQIE
ncbi:hypothetical protein QJS10_CPA02g01130 [Acorus calamus]|uniref:Reverse transcriptase n=1 Tax=Acorus calamus TaxID=4465 RepID=A0AAV9FFI5_ACOCL|nr:hypothetical protein QJS10_CPA02g01130 [Acorus calamus]